MAKPPRILALRDRLKIKLEELEKTGIISKVNKPNERVSNLVVVEESDGSLKVCFDPQELNNAIQRNFYSIPTIEEISHKLEGKEIFSVFDL